MMLTPALAVKSLAKVLFDASVPFSCGVTVCTAHMDGTPWPGNLMVATHLAGSTKSVRRGGITELKKPTAADAAGCLQHQIRSMGGRHAHSSISEGRVRLMNVKEHAARYLRASLHHSAMQSAAHMLAGKTSVGKQNHSDTTKRGLHASAAISPGGLSFLRQHCFPARLVVMGLLHRMWR